MRPSLNVDALQRELLEAKPHLAASIASLKLSSLWTVRDWLLSPLSALPPLPSPAHSRSKAQDLGTQKSRKANPMALPPPLHWRAPFHGTWHKPQMRPQQPFPFQPCMGMPPQLQPGMLDQYQGPRHIFPAMQVGQFARVLHDGQPIGEVQLTQQGWAGPPELLSIFTQQCRSGDHRYLQHATAASPSPQLQTPSGWHAGVEGAWAPPAGQQISSAGTNTYQHHLSKDQVWGDDPARPESGGMQTGNSPKRQKCDIWSMDKTQLHWRAEDIELAEDEDGSGSNSSSSDSESSRQPHPASSPKIAAKPDPFLEPPMPEKQRSITEQLQQARMRNCHLSKRLQSWKAR